MNRYLILFSLWGYLATSLPSQNLTVYPGDATNNGVVNNLDLMAVGLAYNFVGPARDSSAITGFAFFPQDVFPWSYLLPGGLNMGFADCNGNGIVDFGDATPIYANYGTRRNEPWVVDDIFLPGITGIDPILGFDATQAPAMLQPGQTFQLPIVLGSAVLPMDDLYGIAFSIFTEPSQIDNAKTKVDLSEPSWANHDGDRIFMYKKVSNRRVDAAWTRTDRNQRTGHGVIGRADFVIIVDVIDKVAPVRIWTDSIRVTDKYGNISFLAGDTVTFLFEPDSFVQAHEPSTAVHWRVQPNPAYDRIFVECDAPMQTATIHNMLGQTLLERNMEQVLSAEWQLPRLPAGQYILSITSGQSRSHQILNIR